MKLPKRQHFDKRLGVLRNDFQTWNVHHKDIRDYFCPREGMFYGEDRKGERTDENIINEAGVFAARTLGAGMVSGITPRSRPWLRYVPEDPKMAEYQPVKIWLHEAERITLDIFQKSKIYGPLGLMFRRMGTFGLGAFGLFDSFENVIRTISYQPGSYYLGCDPDGNVNTFVREYKYTVLQMVKEFGLDNVPAEVKNHYNQGTYDTPYPIVHFIEPNLERDIDKIDNQNMEFRSVYYHPGDKENYLRESGFEEFPIIAGRWEVHGMGPYANSPAMDVLGSTKQLQVQELQKSEAIEQELNPSLQIPSSLKEGGVIDTLPGGKNYYDEIQGAKGIRRLYEQRLDISDVRLDNEEIINRINRMMYVDLFMMLEQLEGVQPRNELEIIERKEEKLQILGPVLENVDSDVLDPLVNRTFGKIIKNGLLPPPPPELQGQDLGVEYISIVHQAQRAVSVGPIQRTAAFVGQMQQTFPESRVSDKFDPDQAVDEFADAIGGPPRIVRTDEQVEEIRQGVQQQEQAQQMMAMAQSAAESAKTMSETDLGDQNALETLLGAGQQ